MPNPQPSAVNSAHFDGQQVPSITLVQGTLGTSDVQGTALTIPAAGNPATGAQYIEVLGTVTTSSGGGATDYIVNIDSSAGTVSYYGFATPSTAGTAAAWKLKRKVSTGGTQSLFTYADGNANFDNIWTGRGTYTYS